LSILIGTFILLVGIVTGYEVGLHRPSSINYDPATSKSARQVLVANQVEACERSHGMHGQYVAVGSLSQGYSLFEGCEWPPNSSTQADGFWSVGVSVQMGPENDEASGADITTVLEPSCTLVRVTVQFGLQGITTTLKPVTLRAGEITGVVHLGLPWKGPSPYPYIPSNDIAIISNSSYGVTLAKCIS
jgi:hypothetical protein